jgi:hypothetical protein
MAWRRLNPENFFLSTTPSPGMSISLTAGFNAMVTERFSGDILR